MERIEYGGISVEFEKRCRRWSARTVACDRRRRDCTIHTFDTTCLVASSYFSNLPQKFLNPSILLESLRERQAVRIDAVRAFRSLTKPVTPRAPVFETVHPTNSYSENEECVILYFLRLL